MNNQSRSLTINGQPVVIHALSTGEVAVKTKFRETKWPDLLGVISSIFDRKFTEWMPIWTWVIQHPEGIFLVDTGENSQISDPGYFDEVGAFFKWLNTTQFKFRVQRDQEIDRSLETVGLSVDRIDRLLLTHLHIDHIDGVHHFPKTPMKLNRREWEKPYGYLPQLYPDWFKPELVDLNDSYKSFEKVHFLTEAKDLMFVHLPGHNFGQCGVLMRTDQGYVLFAADVAYKESQIKQNTFSGSNVSRRLARNSYRQIQEFARENQLVVLPSHDGEASDRLFNMRFFKP